MDEVERLSVARHTAGLVLRDWQALGGEPARLDVWVADGDVCIWVDGGGATPSAHASRLLPFTVEVADYVHAELVDNSYRVLPMCTEHGCGAHPKDRGGVIRWWCGPGDHSLGRVGELAP